ncbi:MAG: exo-alpha-sialidase [Candidatus Latescibacteria bacterium]|nr:exo-alpha-sialidase [Candidatus Latescibacterota bacterium]
MCAQDNVRPACNVIESPKIVGDFRACRRMLVGPGVNQPAPFPGYTGFVGWESVIRLRNGTWLLGFSAGYWHASPPTPFTQDPEVIRGWEKIGFPADIEAPRGGRAMISRSTDEAMTWSKPETLWDSPQDDRHPNFCELEDGTVLCSFFLYPGGGTMIIRSTDGGETWEQACEPLPGSTDGPIITLQDGSAMICVYGRLSDHETDSECGFFRSVDRGDTWERVAVIPSDHEMSEGSIAQLESGRIVLVTRPEADVCWSDDGGRTWTPPVSLGNRLFEPGLIALRDGTLLCLHGSYAAGGLACMFSRDEGETWLVPKKDRGFAVDPSVYGYGKGIELPDGSVYVVYIHTGGHKAEDAVSNAIWAIRMRVADDYQGIEVLPVPGAGEDEVAQVSTDGPKEMEGI